MRISSSFRDKFNFQGLFKKYLHIQVLFKKMKTLTYSCTVKPVLSGHSKTRPKIDFQDQLSLNAGQEYCRMLQGEHSAILSTLIKLSFVIKFCFVFEWPLKTGLTVLFKTMNVLSFRVIFQNVLRQINFRGISIFCYFSISHI